MQKTNLAAVVSGVEYGTNDNKERAVVRNLVTIGLMGFPTSLNSQKFGKSCLRRGKGCSDAHDVHVTSVVDASQGTNQKCYISC